jgi:hypothetical protein
MPTGSLTEPRPASTNNCKSALTATPALMRELRAGDVVPRWCRAVDAFDGLQHRVASTFCACRQDRFPRSAAGGRPPARGRPDLPGFAGRCAAREQARLRGSEAYVVSATPRHATPPGSVLSTSAGRPVAAGVGTSRRPFRDPMGALGRVSGAKAVAVRLYDSRNLTSRIHCGNGAARKLGRSLRRRA